MVEALLHIPCGGDAGNGVAVVSRHVVQTRVVPARHAIPGTLLRRHSRSAAPAGHQSHVPLPKSLCTDIHGHHRGRASAALGSDGHLAPHPPRPGQALHRGLPGRLRGQLGV